VGEAPRLGFVRALAALLVLSGCQSGFVPPGGAGGEGGSGGDDGGAGGGISGAGGTAGGAGAGGGADVGSGSVEGVVAGLELEVVAAFLFNDPDVYLATDTLPWIMLSDNPTICESFAAGEGPSTGHGLMLNFSQTVSGAPGASPGTYPLSFNTPPEGERALSRVKLGTFAPNCGYNNIEAIDATMELTEISFEPGGRAKGTFEADFAGEMVTGTFDAVYCADVTLATLCQ